MYFPEQLPNKLVFADTVQKLHSVMQKFENKNIRIAYSGGSDSDTVLHLFKLLGYNVSAVLYDTGLEYQVTKNHIEYMRGLGFNIDIIKARRPIPTSQKLYGHPFINKYVSDMLERLQKHNFNFAEHGNLSLEELLVFYPHSKSALRWWTNNHISFRNNISWNKYLKEFLIENGLPFKVSGKCCDGAKKLPIKEYTKENNIDLMILGIRKAEGGQRSVVYKNCFVPKRSYTYSMYFPLFWWSDSDKLEFDTTLNIKHSDAYSVYGLKRTGCAGCPFGRAFEDELTAINTYEPKLAKGINIIFDKSYEWTRKYKEFCEQQKKREY